MAAFLRQQLILDMHRAGAGILEAAHHVHHVERFAVAGIAIDQHRQAGGAGDLADEKADFIYRDNAEVGQAHRGRHRRAGQIQPLESCRLGLQRRLAVMGARQLHNAGAGEQSAEAIAGRGGRQVVGDEVGHGGPLNGRR